MNFRPRRQDEPEINLIPFIDVLLVVLIFLMLSTTYSKFTELQLRLPQADADAQRDYPRELIVSVSAEGRFAVNKVAVQGNPDSLAMAMAEAAKGGRDTVVVISADATSATLARLGNQGVRAYLTKPLDVAEFFTVIDRLLA